jgi:hypothetical protein
VISANEVESAPYIYSTPAAGPIDFQGAIFVNSGNVVNAYQDTVAVQASVPGPLPILGVAAAFGSVRRLRRRRLASLNRQR